MLTCFPLSAGVVQRMDLVQSSCHGLGVEEVHGIGLRDSLILFGLLSMFGSCGIPSSRSGRVLGTCMTTTIQEVYITLRWCNTKVATHILRRIHE